MVVVEVGFLVIFSLNFQQPKEDRGYFSLRLELFENTKERK